MFHALPEYPEYQSAGGWISSVPSTWRWEPARTLFAERKVTGFIEENLLSVTIGRGVIPQSALLSTTAKKDSSNLDKSKYKLVEPGDLVYNKMRAWQGASGGSNYRGIVSPAYIVMRPRAVLTDYMHHLLRTPMFASEAERWSYGITSDQWSLRPEHFKMIRFPVPPSGEQAAIVRYLAHANARIDKAITAKRRLSSLLEEQRRAVAHEHLTHGGWPSWPLGKIGRIGNGSTPSRSVQSYWGGTTPWLNSAVVNQESVSQSNQFVTDEALANCHLPLVSAESVLVGITGQGRTRGMSTVLRIEATVNQHIAFITPNEKLASADYVNLALTVGYGELRQISEGVGGTKGALTLTDLKSFKIPLPSLSQQEQVLADVRRLSIELRNALTRVQREISLLEEFRTRLVADVVTGQVDVRAIAASLPDTPEQHTDLGSLLDDDIEDVLGQGEE